MDPRDKPTEPFAEGDVGSEPASYGRFLARGLIGRGGMGVVLRARDPELDRDVAIKVLTPGTMGSRASSGARLQREAQAMAKLAHPNVVAVFETGLVGETRYIAMELVDGTTLRTWLSERSRRWNEIVAMFVACGRGLAAAHAEKIVHRDFKPDNVLIGRDDRPRVSDFGLVDADHGIAGTPAYMAPEQWLAEPVDARADQFSYCVALWEALYGVRPFEDGVDGSPRACVLAAELRDPPRDRSVPRRIEAALRRGLARKREARWPAMEPLLAELDRRPRRTWVAIAAVAAAAVATGVIVIALRSADDEVVIAPMTLRTGSCAQLCKELATCDLALPSCTTDCETNLQFQSCLVDARNCDERAACHWNKVCGRPVRSAGLDCTGGVQCWGQTTAQDVSIQCAKCYDLLTPKAATALARYTICFAVLGAEMAPLQSDPLFAEKYQKEFAARCEPLGLACSTQSE